MQIGLDGKYFDSLCIMLSYKLTLSETNIGNSMIVDEEKFVIKAYLKADLARLYSPNLPAGYAMCKLRSWIRRNKELHAHMYEGGEGKGDHSYTRRQVRLIFEYLGEP